MPPKKRSAAEDEDDSNTKQLKPNNDAPNTNLFTGNVFVITGDSTIYFSVVDKKESGIKEYSLLNTSNQKGTFPMSSDMIERRIISLGGKVVSAVSKSTTHILLGETGLTQYGQKTGVGSKKYKDAKKRKCTEVSYQDLVDAEATSSASSSSDGGGAMAAASKLQKEWDEFVKTLQAGADKGLWEMPTFKPPATLEEIGTIEKEFGFRFGKYNDLLLLTNGMYWYADVKVDETGIGKHVPFIFGGTGDGEYDLRHAFNYSGDYGRKHFRSRKQVPMNMIDYDFCVNVFEVNSGKIMQDDRECETYKRLNHSIQEWIEETTSTLNKALAHADENESKKTAKENLKK